MKKLLSLLFVAMMLVSLAACGSKETSKAEAGDLYIFLPGEYFSEDAKKAFEKETGIRVHDDTFDSNESMYTKLLGGTVYDIVIPSDYMIERLIKEDYLQKIDKLNTYLVDLYFVSINY